MLGRSQIFLVRSASRRALLGLLLGPLLWSHLAESKICIEPLLKNSSTSFTENQDEAAQVIDYLQGTLHSLRLMRGDNGLIADKIEVSADGTKILKSLTSPTNIALDILVLVERSLNPQLAKLGEEDPHSTLTKIIAALEEAPIHRRTQLFYSWYSTESGPPRPHSLSVSAVDNMHLALALWTLKEALPETEMGQKAFRLFQRMDFSIFAHLKSNLFRGNLKFEGDGWKLEFYHYGNLGSEARSLYTLGYALGLLKGIENSEDFFSNAIRKIKAEMLPTPEGEILGLWDGGTFQMLLPEVLIGESQYSKRMDEIFENFGRYKLNQAQRKNLPIGAAGFSASNMGVEGRNDFEGFPHYSGHLGNVELVSRYNSDLHNSELRSRWESVVTPHAIMLATPENPRSYLAILKDAESLGGAQSLYQSGLGWMDALHVNGPHKGKVVPVQLSLNQGMIALSLIRLLDENHLSASARYLEKNPLTRRRLQKVYESIDEKLK